MARPLVIVESPAKARTISGFLGDDYTVEASIGHIRDLPRSRDEVPEAMRETHGRLAGINPDNHFDVCYISRNTKVITALKRALKGADELILATDEDREGEAISWHILEVLKPSVPVKRMVFHEITRSAIAEALANPRDLDMDLVAAQDARRVLDRLVGWETSPILWRIFGQGQAPSAGRVQSVAVRLVVERERARMRFRSGAWHDVEGTFTAAEHADHPFTAKLAELDGRRIAEGRDFDSDTGAISAARDGEVVLLDEQAATGIVTRLADRPFRVSATESTPFTERPRAPFTTSTLQQAAGGRFGFASSRTMAVAQRLYERGYITYMRTDSTNLSGQAITAARTAITERFGAEYLPAAPRAYAKKVKNAQEAHEAIRPAGERIRTPEDVRGELDADEARVYELVWNRTVACQMADARGRRLTIRLASTTTDDEHVVFRASGKAYDFLGWRRVYEEEPTEGDAENEEERRFPPLAQGDKVDCSDLRTSGHETKPPARFTEPSLVKELEERGIGRPSTYAAVVGTIQDRGYVWKRGTALVPAWVAFGVTNLLEQRFGHLVDYSFTATMEEALDQIANGSAERDKWLDTFYFGNGTPGLRELVSTDLLGEIDPRAVSTIPIGIDADGRDVVVRVGRYGPFVAAGEDTASIPDDIAPDEMTVERALEFIAAKAAGPQTLGTDPATGLEVFVLAGRFGPYVQVGEVEAGSKKKPKRASLLSFQSPETLTLDEALVLLSLPRLVGTDAEGREILASPGRFGPYLKRSDGETRSLTDDAQILSVTVAEAEALYLLPKRGRGRQAKPPIAELGEHPDNGAPVRVLEGRFGPYVTDGTINATVPKGVDPGGLSLDEAVALLRAREAAGGGRTKKKTAKKATKKAPAKKTAKKATKKAVKKTAKKATKKATKKAAPRLAATSGTAGDAESAAEHPGGR